MPPRRLAEIGRLSHLSPRALRERDPELFGELRSRVSTRTRAYIRTTFPKLSPALREHLLHVDLPLAEWPDRHPKDVLLETLAARNAAPEVRAEATRILTDLERAGLLPAAADLDRSIAELPFFEQELAQAAVAAIADAARVPDEKVDRVLSRAGSASALTEDTLDALVRDGVLREDEAGRLGLTVSLFHAADRNAELVTALTGEAFAGLGGKPVGRLRDLAALTADDWEQAIGRAGVHPPAGLDRRAMADALERKAAAMFPTDALLARVLPRTTGFIAPALARLGPVLERNPGLFDRPFDALAVDGLTTEQIALARAAHGELRRLSNLHPGLRLGEVLGARAGAAETVRAADHRLGLLDRVARQNPETELLALDYRPESADLAALRLDGLSADERQMVLDDFKAHQRAFGITDDVVHAVTLLAAGYSSARSVATTPFDTFRRTTGLDEATARTYHVEAKQVLGDAALTLVAIGEVVRDGFDLIEGAGNTEPAVQEYLRKLQGFADLFGSQDFCQCRHCQSILGPAAYFVDLMCFAEEQALGVFTGAKAGHPLNLKVRRPDLWTLELTCRNTDELIPTLDLINEILENAIAVRRGFAGGLDDRAAVEEEVYHQAISTAVDSFRQPFVLPLEKLAIYLSHFERERADVARVLAAPAAVQAAAVLGLSRREYELVTQANSTVAFLRGVYGVPFTVAAGGTVDPIDVQEMLTFTGLSRADFGSLAASRYVTADGAVPVEIRAEKRSADSLQNDVERIHGLTLEALDRLHRLTRLWRRLGWTVAEVDLALAHLAAAGLAAGIGEPAILALSTVVTLRARLGLPVEQTLALFSGIPAVPVVESRKSLLDRLFNVPPFVTADGPLPNGAVSFVHPSLRQSGTPLPSDNTLNRLLAGLQVSDDQLGQLVTALGVPLGANLAAADEDDRGFPLTLGNLTLLYRHARLAQRLTLAVPDLFQLIGLAGIAGGHVATLADLSQLLEFHDWWRTSGFTLDELGFVTHGPVQGTGIGPYPDPAAAAAQVAADLSAERALRFADTVFAFLPGVTEEQSRQVVAANAAAIEPLADGSGYRLRSAFDPAAALTIPAGVSLTEADAKALLLKHHASAVLPLRIASRLGMTLDTTTELVAMTGVDLGAAPLVDALWGGAIAPLSALLTKIAPLAVLLRRPALDAAALEFVRTHAALFGIADFNAIGMPAVRTLSVYVARTDPAEVPSDAPAWAAVDPEAVRSVLVAFDPVTKFDGADTGELARALRIDPVLLTTLLPNLTLPGTAPEALAMLDRAAELAHALGVGGEALRLMVSDDYGDLTRASDAVLSALRAKYPDEKDFADRTEPLLDRLRSRRRDALVDYLIRSAHPQFRSPGELYAYFLVDVQLEGCARTSRVVAAISSVQLYIHRCILNLEQDDLPPADPDHVRVELSKDAIDEWTWRKNYRVWEANRKVFLYPENYIEPELRDDKTPLFTELESTLLQQRITEQNVLDAYASYLSGFEEVARLRIAGSYHDIGPGGDVLHLFGVTSGDPSVYYYRTIENAYHGESGETRAPVHTPWRRIDVQIPVRRVAPIVHLGRLFVFWVEITTSPRNEVAGGGSEFVGYKHKLTVRYTTLRLDGTWTPPQAITLGRTGIFADGEGIVTDPLAGQVPKYDDERHDEPIDGYTLEGFQWDRVYPGVSGSALRLTGRNFLMAAPVDFYRKLLSPGGSGAAKHAPADGQVLCSRTDAGGRRLYYGVQDKFKLDDYAQCTVVADQRRLDALASTEAGALVVCLSQGLYQQAIARLNDGDEINVVNGSVTDAIIDANGDLLLLQGSVRPGPDYLLKRLGTTLTEALVRTLFTTGVSGLLATETQKGLAEAPLPITPLARIENAANAGTLDFKGPYGTYYRELFFHIPFLIANHLNGQQRFAAAQRWYHFVFDPTATETIALPPGLSEAEQAKKLRNRVWRYLEFRDLDVPKLQEILSDPAAIEVYRKDPFNPHAIARLRLSAYQKCIVMKYIDNLLDWGDSLFAQFTTESLNEATMLYVMAADILGARPAELGQCGEEQVTPRNYETIAPLMKAGHGFLGEIETYTWSRHPRVRWRGPAKRSTKQVLMASDSTFYGRKAAGAKAKAARVTARAAGTDGTMVGVAHPYGWQGTWTASWKADTGAPSRVIDIDSPILDDAWRAPGFTWSVTRQFVPVFCVPPNKDLLAYWDRVEDRLYKLRHCLDITGVFRRPALFAPEIDPRLLVRARAAGLSIEEVLDATSGNLPPYRFTYLIEKAKQAAAVVQGFGAALLSALEKKDLEELTRLRAVHQQNLLRMTTRMREWEITTASDAIAALERQKTAAQYRKDYYQGLIDGGLTPAETTQQVSRHTASVLGGVASLQQTLGAVLYLIPQLGSPFAMKYGGLEIGNSAQAFATLTRTLAAVAEAVSASAGLEAGFGRREEGWQHQVELADHDLKQIEKQLSAATLRKDIAVRSLQLHSESLKQLDELAEFYNERFSTLGLYTWLSTTLQRTYREAYNSAYAMARLAEQAYRYERGDETTPLLRPDYWDAARAGLLAGERLVVDLQNLERRFIETNYRKLEVDQAFSLTQIDPAALVRLRETGSCDFELPEIFFDLFYPGQYRRRITSVRLTIPCITGPYTNVGATLTLTGSKIRHEAKLGAANLADVPLRRSVSVATSTAQNDAGVFEFGFRDERYMPFEGAGAVSSWRLALPGSFRQFDYQTITDVILHVSYTAEEDALFREKVEALNSAVEGTILNALGGAPLGRVFSLRQDFSSAFNRLLHSPPDTVVRIELSGTHLPIFLRGKALQVTKAVLALRPAPGQSVNGFQLALDGAVQAGFAADPDLGDLPSRDVGAVFAGGLLGEHTLAVKAAGDLAPAAPAPGDLSAVDGGKLLDVVLYVELRVP